MFLLSGSLERPFSKNELSHFGWKSWWFSRILQCSFHHLPSICSVSICSMTYLILPLTHPYIFECGLYFFHFSFLHFLKSHFFYYWTIIYTEKNDVLLSIPHAIYLYFLFCTLVISSASVSASVSSSSITNHSNTQDLKQHPYSLCICGLARD